MAFSRPCRRQAGAASVAQVPAFGSAALRRRLADAADAPPRPKQNWKSRNPARRDGSRATYCPPWRAGSGPAPLEKAEPGWSAA
jgi:hypothetical protein